MDRRQSSVLSDSTSSSSYYHHPAQYHDSVASLAYRPLHSPLQQLLHHPDHQLQRSLLHQQHQPSHVFLHRQHHPAVTGTTDQQQTSSALAYQQQGLQHLHSPFHHQPSDFRQDFSSYTHQPSPTSTNSHRNRIMSSYDEAPVPALSEEELAELQKASASFEPEVKVCLRVILPRLHRILPLLGHTLAAQVSEM